MEWLTFHRVNPLYGENHLTFDVQVSTAPTTVPPAPAAPTETLTEKVVTLDQLWGQASVSKRAELAVSIIDEMEKRLR